MVNNNIPIEPMSVEAFMPFGDVIDASGDPTVMINNGHCERYTDRAKLDFAQGGRAGISVFYAQPYALPHRLSYVERHPLGSQAFLPLSGAPFLVTVAHDISGVPDTPRAFLTHPEQGVNIHRGVWHGVLTPLNRAAQFAVVDWIGDRENLEEHHFQQAWLVYPQE